MIISDGYRHWRLAEEPAEGGAFFTHPGRKSRVWLPSSLVEALRAGRPVSLVSRTRTGVKETTYNVVEA